MFHQIFIHLLPFFGKIVFILQFSEREAERQNIITLRPEWRKCATEGNTAFECRKNYFTQNSIGSKW